MTAQELKDFAPYVTAVVALVVFFVTRQSESRKRNADVLGDFIATAQEVAHSIAEVWRTAPRTKAFDIDDATWKRTVGEVDAKLTQLLRKVQIVGSNKTVAAAENVRNSVNAMRDAIEFSLETDSGTNVYVGTPASSKLGSRWAKANAASLKRVHGCEPADVESLPLAWERPSAGHVSDSELDAQSAEGGSASDAEVKAAFTSGWLVVWGIWRHDRDEFIHLARRQVGPRPRWVWLAVGLAVVLGLAGLFWVVA